MKFCKKCFKMLSERWAKRAGYDPRHILDVKKMIFPCQVPIYEPDNVGNPMVRTWDCEKEVSVVYTLKEWQKKQEELKKKEQDNDRRHQQE